MKWRIGSSGQLYDPGEDFVVYYDPASGDTHLLSAVAGAVLRLIDHQPLEATQLVAELWPDAESDVLPLLCRDITSLLEELQALEVVVQV